MRQITYNNWSWAHEHIACGIWYQNDITNRGGRWAPIQRARAVSCFNAAAETGFVDC